MVLRTSMFAVAAAIGIAAAGSAGATTVFADRIDWSGSTGDTAGVFDAVAQTNTNARNIPGDALGAPDQVGNSEGGFLALGRGGAAVFGFGTNFGTTATVFEVTFGCSGPQDGDLCNFDETADVYALTGDYTPVVGSFDVNDLTSLGFVKVGAIPNGLANRPEGASISIAGPFSFLALVDTSVQGSDGFDVDAVSVSAVPLPASVLLLLAGVGGLGVLRARRSA